MSGRLARAIDRVPLSLFFVLLIGIGLRVALSLEYRPAYATSFDTKLFLDVAAGELFSDPTRPVGYPLFLRALHAVSDDVVFTVAFQHLLGIASGLILYATVRRIGAPVWVAVVGAAAILLPLDQAFLEHILMTEAPFTFALMVMLYAAVRALDAPRALREPLTSRHLWIVLAAVALGLSAWLRTATVPLVPFLALWFAFAISGRRAERLGRAALALGAAGIVLVSYMALSASYGGGFALSNASGWALYSRVAPFADCSRFEPPSGTEALCETTPVEDRPGPDFYAWQPGSPAVQLFGDGDEQALLGGHDRGDEQLAAFARQALIHQPLSYAKVVARDFTRYYVPGFDPQDFSGYGYDELDVELRLPDAEALVLASINDYYADTELRVGDERDTLGEVQDVVRVHPKLLLLATLLALAGLFTARGRARSGLALLLGTSLILLAVPPATAIWSSRYAIPVQGPLAAAGAMGGWLLWTRVRARLEARPRQWSRSAPESGASAPPAA